MKFRVETWDTTEKCGDWVCVLETGEADLARVDFAWWVKFSEPHVCIRLREYRNRWSGWQFVVNKYGTLKETKPMASRVVYDCGCASCGEDEYPCNAHKKKTVPRCNLCGHPTFGGPTCALCIEGIRQCRKETKPMSTKQRGDVEKIPAEKVPVIERPERFKVRLEMESAISGMYNPEFAYFTRDEFRRVWEAGNREFFPSDVLHEVVRQKDAEIARLKYLSEQTGDIVRENQRLRSWLMRWKRKFMERDEVDRALAGEKVPE